MARRTVFVSYSHADAKWLKRLQVHLRPLERDGLLELWDDTKIASGSQWREEIRKAIGGARVAILLVSADFLASGFIATDELPPLLAAAETDGTVILPLLVKASMFERMPALSRFQAVNSPSTPLDRLPPSRREQLFTELAERIQTILESDGAGTDHGGSSSPGGTRGSLPATRDVELPSAPQQPNRVSEIPLTRQRWQEASLSRVAIPTWIWPVALIGVASAATAAVLAGTVVSLLVGIGLVTLIGLLVLSMWGPSLIASVSAVKWFAAHGRTALVGVSGIAVAYGVSAVEFRPDPELVSLTLSDERVPADGATATRVIAEVGPILVDETNRVFFTTTAGGFMGPGGTYLPTAVVALDGRRADVVLISPNEPGIARIRANVANHQSRVVTVAFERALPDRIELSTSDSYLMASPEGVLRVTARLLRNVGTPSKDTFVGFSAMTPDGSPIGSFSEVTSSDANGVASASFSVGRSTYRGNVVLTATAAGVSRQATLSVRGTP